jgi:hypothetical protein
MDPSSSWEAAIRLVTQEFSKILLNSKAYCRVQKNPPFFSILSHMILIFYVFYEAPHY